MNVSRRSMVKMAAAGVVMAGSLRAVGTSAQEAPASPYLFPNGPELTWVEPWQSVGDENPLASFLPNSLGLRSENGEVAVGYFDATTSVDDAAAAVFAVIEGATSVMAGGGGSGGGETQIGYRLYAATAGGDQVFGMLVHLTNGQELIVFTAPVAEFGAEMASAQSSVMIDGVGILGGLDGASLKSSVEAVAPGLTIPVGEYTNEAGDLHVTWTNGWTENSRDEWGVEVTNPANSITLAIQWKETEGLSWQELANGETAFIIGDQGDSPMDLAQIVTEDTFLTASDGQYGLRLLEGTHTSNPEVFAIVFAHTIEAKGAEAEALFRDAQAAVTVNGEPVFRDLDQFIAEYVG